METLLPSNNNFSNRNIFLVASGSLTAILNILLIMLIMVHRKRFWVSYWNYLLSMLISSSCFAIIGFSLEVNTINGQMTDSKTMDNFLCKIWYFSCGAVYDGSLLSLLLLNIDRGVSLISRQNYTTKAYEKGSKLALGLTWVTIIIINLTFAFHLNQSAQFLPTRPCLHLMHHRNGYLSLVWGSMHFISSVFLVVAAAVKAKSFPHNEIENKVTGCVLAILLLDFFIVFLRFAPEIASQIKATYNYQETKDLLYLVRWSSQMLPPLFWLLDSKIRKFIEIIFCKQCCTKQSKSVDLVKESEKRESRQVTGETDM